MSSPGSRGARARAHLDVVALAHAGAEGVQASEQVGRAAALSKVIGDAAGEAQGSESAAQTWGGRREVRLGAARATCRLRPGRGEAEGPGSGVEGRGGIECWRKRRSQRELRVSGGDCLEVGK